LVVFDTVGYRGEQKQLFNNCKNCNITLVHLRYEGRIVNISEIFLIIHGKSKQKSSLAVFKKDYTCNLTGLFRGVFPKH
jgi:hypothetical protein